MKIFDSQPQYKKPPGASVVSLSKTLHSFFDPHGYFEMMQAEYGDIFSDEFFGISNVVCVSSPTAIEQIFAADASLFRPTSESTPPDPLLGSRSLVALHGARHQKRKKLLMPPFHGERIKAYGETIRTLTLDSMHQNYLLGRFLARVTAQEITLSVILKCVFGLCDGDRYRKLREQIAAYLNFFEFPLNAAFSLFPFLQQDIGGWSPWSKLMRIRDSLDALLYEQIREKRQNPELLGQDILSLLLTSTDEEGQRLTDEDLRDELMLLLVAGHETTSLSVAWALYWIHYSSEIQRKLRQELASINPNDIDATEINKLPYLHAVCQETLRIYPVALTTLPRILRVPMELMGYWLPEGTMLLVPINLVHHRSELYPNPKEFIPERFLERQYSPYEYLPFGGGSRRCLGSALALYEMKIILITILLHYRLSLVEHKPLSPVRRGVVFAPEGGVELTVDDVLR